jgi:lysophospholipase L1-like esterase
LLWLLLLLLLLLPLQEYPGWELHLVNDGLHFTPAGAHQVWQHLKATIESSFPQLR